MNKYLIFGFFLLLNPVANAQTIVFGQAATADGQENTMLLEQPANSPNPLGNPIVLPAKQPIPEKDITDEESPSNSNGNTQENPALPTNVITQNLPTNPRPSAQYTLKKEDSMIQNTIYRGTDRLYDIQSIPLKELKKINVNGLDPDLTTYPVY